MPLKPGDSTFNKVLKDSGGYVLDNKWIKYIFSVPIPDGVGFVTYTKEIVMRFCITNDKLKSRLIMYLYEPVTNNHYCTNTLKFIQFNGKVYKVINRKIINTVSENNNTYYKYGILLDEI